LRTAEPPARLRDRDGFFLDRRLFLVELCAVQLLVPAAGGEYVAVSPAFDDASVFDDEDLVGRTDGRQPVRDSHTCPAGQGFAEGGLYCGLRCGVEVRGRLVEDDDAGTGQERPRDGEPLPFSARQAVPAFADDGVAPIRK
jgi:hypothetical protein